MEPIKSPERAVEGFEYFLGDYDDQKYTSWVSFPQTFPLASENCTQSYGKFARDKWTSKSSNFFTRFKPYSARVGVYSSSFPSGPIVGSK